jgi:hypothetical protein
MQQNNGLRRFASIPNNYTEYSPSAPYSIGRSQSFTRCAPRVGSFELFWCRLRGRAILFRTRARVSDAES